MSRTMRGGRTAAAVTASCVAGALLLGGCGGAGDAADPVVPTASVPATSMFATSASEAPPPTAAPTTSTPSASVAVVTAGASPSATTVGSSTAPAGPFADLAVPMAEDYCVWATHADALFTRWMELARTPDDNEAYVTNLQPTWDRMRQTAPDELVPHFEVVTPTFEFIWESLAASGYDVDAQRAEHGDEILARRDQAFLASAHAIDVYGSDVCGITPP